jgi:hypothetical protein
MVAFSGFYFYESHKPPQLGKVRRIVPAHHHSHGGVFCIVVSFDVALAAAGAIQSKYSPDGGI